MYMQGVFRFVAVGGVVALGVLAAGCASVPPTSVHQPMTARPSVTPAVAASNGAIFNVATARPLFEDRRARFVGDTLTIEIAERTQASTNSSAESNRSQSMSVTPPRIAGLPGRGLANLDLSLESENEFSGGGKAAANNDFRGTITVTVIEVLPNGNLLVSGEKQLSIHQQSEFLRFSGVVNPANITGGNTVKSTQVADARLEHKGTGYIAESQVMGWLARFFLNVLPF